MGSDDKAEILAAIDALGERIEARISVMEKKIDAIASHSPEDECLGAAVARHRQPPSPKGTKSSGSRRGTKACTAGSTSRDSTAGTSDQRPGCTTG